MKILVVGAHPDDEVLGCGATMAGMSRQGHEVYIAVLGEGITSRSNQTKADESKSLSSLHEQSLQVAHLLGAKDLLNFQLPDNRFDTVPLLDIVKIIEGLIDKLQPEVIYCHHGGDLNIDHALVHRAVLTATRPARSMPVREVLAFEVASATEWAFQQFRPVFKPNIFVDIEDTIDLKIKGMEIYESEARAFPHPRSEEALRAQARRWGSVVGLQFVEAFELVRAVRV